MKQLMKYLAALLLVAVSFFTADASLVIVNGLSHEHTVTPGGRVQGSIEIKNTADEEKRARIYKADLIHECDGQTQFLDNDKRDKCNSKWTELSDNEIVLGPKQTYTLTYQLAPGADVQGVGSYWGVIMVEEIKNLDTITPQRGVTVTSLIRYAIQIISNFEGEYTKDLGLDNVTVDTTREETFVTVNVQNLGNVMLKPIMILEVYNDMGEQVFRNELNYQKVYPGYCKLFEIPLEGMPAGEYDAVLVADCGDDNLYGLEMRLSMPDKTSGDPDGPEEAPETDGMEDTSPDE